MANPDDPETGIHGGDFCDLIESIGFGSLKQKLEENLAELAEAVKDTGKNGKLVLTITLKKAGEHAGIAADVKTTKPQHSVPESVFFFGQKGRLHRDNPKQTRLKEVSVVPTPLRTVKPSGGEEN
jgi:hypothetical protein